MPKLSPVKATAMHRRNLLKGALFGATALVIRPSLAMPEIDATNKKLAALERQYGGRLGVAIMDTATQRRILYRADERFMMCSTFKLLLAGAVLARVDQGTERLDRRIVFERSALVSYAPITSTHVGPPGMTISDLCRAAITVSDGVAANALLRAIGGPAALTAYLRRLGDPLTRSDRYEPEMNRPTPDHISDTTTPLSMLADLRALAAGHALSDGSRKTLIEWLRAADTGADLVRAGLPSKWVAGDKTGHGNGATNDVVIVWPTGRPPLLISVFYKSSTNNDDDRPSELFVEVGRIAAAMID